MELAVWTDVKKIFGNYRIYFCMFGLGLVYIWGYLSSLSSGAHLFGIVASYENIAVGSEMELLSFLLCIVGGSFLYCAEEKYGYLNFEIQRIGFARYTLSKLFTSVIGGFFTLIAANVVFLIGILIHSWFAFGTITFEGENIMFMLWMWLFAALRCSVLSAMGFLVSTYVTNHYIAMTMPLLMYYAILQVEHWVFVFFPMIPPEFRFSKVYLAGIIEGNDLQEFVFALLYTACILVIVYLLAKKCIKRRLEHA